MPILVTGATGRTGAGVVRHLRAQGEEVRVLVRDGDKAKQTFEGLHGVEIATVPSTTKPFSPRRSKARTSPSWR